MNWLQFRNDQDVKILGWYTILKVQFHCFADVLVEFVDGLTLGKDIFADSARTPKFTIIVYFDFDQHSLIL